MNLLADSSPVLDVACEICPVSLFKVNDRLNCLSAGESLDVIVGGDDQLRKMAINIKAEGYRIEAVRRHGAHHILRVRKEQ
ncbi:MAG: hypothetical protein N3D11_13505 [Candidatus Sumerlaeia bacterium]|nr:hypothetical protein [Candidatus Sumerlaeia bacterium]